MTAALFTVISRANTLWFASLYGHFSLNEAMLKLKDVTVNGTDAPARTNG